MATASHLPIAQIFKLSVPEYDALPRIRSTSLKTIIEKSPKHYRHEQLHRKPSTAAMQLGIATHAALFEPAAYLRDVVTADMAGKKSKQWEAFVLSHPGKIPILESEAETISAMVEAIRQDQDAAPYLQAGDPEMSVLWTDPDTGIDCMARFDLLDETDPSNPIGIGLKTTRSLGKVFDRQVDDYLYQLSWAMYREGYYHVRGVWPEMIEIVVETSEPHDVIVYRVGEEAIEAGTTLYRGAMREIAECTRTGVWPGVGRGGVQPLRLKPWARGMQAEDNYQLEETGES